MKKNDFPHAKIWPQKDKPNSPPTTIHLYLEGHRGERGKRALHINDSSSQEKLVNIWERKRSKIYVAIDLKSTIGYEKIVSPASCSKINQESKIHSVLLFAPFPYSLKLSKNSSKTQQYKYFMLSVQQSNGLDL